ncbi:MAG: hypothetical protein KC435_11680 [Thermomicrobiales bacterium]|nr:hypothetical protein [Thermomicrobiales bacterium]
MTNQTTTNATPSVQVHEIGLPQQTPVAPVVAGAAALIGLAYGLGRKRTEPAPKSVADSSRAYLRAALARAQESDLAKVTAKQAKTAEKKVKTARVKAKGPSEQTMKELEKLGKKIGEQVSGAQGEAVTLLSALKESGPEIEKIIQTEIKTRLAGFAGDAKAVAEVGKEKSADLTSQARQTAEKVSADAQESMQGLVQTAEEKRKVAVESVQRGGQETRSLVIWMAAAGALVYGVLLNEEQQRKVRDTLTEAYHEIRALIHDVAS